MPYPQSFKETMVVETDIHYPTDSSLLWEAFRVLARILRRVRDLAPGRCPHRFHDRKAKKLHVAITRGTLPMPHGKRSRSNKRRLKKNYRKLIECVQRLATIVRRLAKFALKVRCAELRRLGETLHDLLPIVEKVIDQSVRAQLHGEAVRAAERVFEVLAADAGFRSNAEKFSKLQEKVEILAIPQRVADRIDEGLAPWHRFRAGVEGTISVLKRAFGLKRCFLL